MVWFRYLAVPSMYGTLTLNSRQLYAVEYFKDKFVISTEEGLKSEIDSTSLERLLLQSRSFTGADRKSCNPSVEAIKENAEEGNATPEPPKTSVVQPANAPSSPIIVSTHGGHLVKSTPKVPRSFPIKIELLPKETTVRYAGGADVLEPIASDWLPIVEDSLHYLGTRFSPSALRFYLCESKGVSTSFNRFTSAKLLHGTNYLVLNRWQLFKLNSNIVDTAFTAQVITHEYAHYAWHAGIVKQSDREIFRKKLAARRLHPDQFNHAGYNNPWYEEAWAVLAEYMVHGQSARGLASVEGWEIVAKYFDNNYLKDGVPTGNKY